MRDFYYHTISVEKYKCIPSQVTPAVLPGGQEEVVEKEQSKRFVEELEHPMLLMNMGAVPSPKKELSNACAPVEEG